MLVYGINAGDQAANPDALLELIDKNNDRRDDRIVSRVSLPSDFLAVGVEPFFERGSDRAYITGVRLDGSGTPVEARLFTVAFDQLNPANSTLLHSLELPSKQVRGLRVRNARVLLGMGEEGVGIVDSFLPNKTYLVESLAAEPRQPLLDVATENAAAGDAGILVAVGGEFNFRSNRLTTVEANGSGGFYVFRQDGAQGLRQLGKLDLPGTRVALQGRFAYVAAGASGVAVVDLQGRWRRAWSRGSTTSAMCTISTSTATRCTSPLAARAS